MRIPKREPRFRSSDRFNRPFIRTLVLEGTVPFVKKEPENLRNCRVPSSPLEWPRRREEGKAELFEVPTHRSGLLGILSFKIFQSERQPVVLRFAEPPALSPWRFAPRGEGDRPNLRFWGAGRRFGRTVSLNPRRAWLPSFSSLPRLVGSLSEKKERWPPKPKTERITERIIGPS